MKMSAATEKKHETIHQLAYEGKLQLLKQKIRKNNSLASLTDESGRVALHWAVSGGHADIAIYLLSFNDVDICDEVLLNPLLISYDVGWSSLMIAVSAGHEVIIDNLLSQLADVNIINSTGQCPLHYAASKDRYRIAEKLLQHNANPNVSDNYGNTPLHRCASKDLVKMTKLLLSYNADVGVSDCVGNTPLHICCEEDRSQVAMLLVDHGASVTTLNKESMSPLDLAPRGLKQALLKKVS